MYEETEAERYRAKVKDEYEEFVRNQDVYATLKKLKGFDALFETALFIFQCSAEELMMEHVKDLEDLLKIAKHKYHALVSIEEDETDIVISDEEVHEPRREVQKPVEINWHMPREIPVINKNMVQKIPQPQVNNNLFSYVPHQNMMHQSYNPWRSHAPNYGTNTVHNVPQIPLVSQAPPRQQFNPFQNAGVITPSGYIFNQSMLSFPPPAPYSSNLQQPFPPPAPFSSNYQYNPQVPSTSRHVVPEKPVARSYREHKLMREQEKRKKEEEQRKRQEEQRIRHERLLMKKHEEEKQERERNKQKELDQNQNGDKTERISNFNIRRQQIANYNKRENDEQAGISSNQSESGKSIRKNGKENKKTVTWADDSNASLSNLETNGENNPSTSKSCDNSVNAKSMDNSVKSPISSKAQIQTQNEKGKDSTTKPKPPKKDEKAVPAKKSDGDEKTIEKASKSENPVSLSTKPESSKDNESDTKKPENKAIDEATGKINRLNVYHPKPKPVMLLKDTDKLIKRRSNSPTEDSPQPKRLKQKSTEDGHEEPSNSNCDIRNENTLLNIKIKEEQISDDENLDGKTDVSSNEDNEMAESGDVQRMESIHIRIKQEPEEDLDIETASTVENIDIKEEVMSTIDQDNSSIHSEKLEIDHITENFINVCGDPELINKISEKFIDFSQFENVLTQDDGKSQNNNNEVQWDSQDKCASWLEGIKNSDYDRAIESPGNQSIQDEQFYLTKDEEAEPDDDIVPYFPVRQLGQSEIVPKEEEQ